LLCYIYCNKYFFFIVFQVADIDTDPKTSSEAGGLAKNELGEFEFIVTIAGKGYAY
jgi:hypothetical protein